MLFIKINNEYIMECTTVNNNVIVRLGPSELSPLNPFYRTYKTDYLTVDCLINELLQYTNNLVISDNLYDVLEEEL